jgi:hypothetical protein
MYYAYNANGIALGGIIKTPKRRIIPSVGSVALAPTGGEGVSVVTNYDEGGISFDRSETRVFGDSPDGRTHYTRADVLMKRLNVFDQIQVEWMMASVTTVREVVDGEAIDREFLFEASYEGLRINGGRVIPAINTRLFNSNPTYDGFLNALAQDENAEYRALMGMGPDDVKTLIPPSQTRSLEMPTIRCSLLSQPVSDSGFAVDVRDVGRVHLAEALIKPGRRRLTLFRVELGRKDTLAPGGGFPTLPPDSDSGPGKGTGEAPPLQALMAGRVQFLHMATNEEEPPDGGSMTFGSVEGNGSPGRP